MLTGLKLEINWPIAIPISRLRRFLDADSLVAIIAHTIYPWGLNDIESGAMDVVGQGIAGCPSQSDDQEAAGRVCRLPRHFLRPLVLVGTGMLHLVGGALHHQQERELAGLFSLVVFHGVA